MKNEQTLKLVLNSTYDAMVTYDVLNLHQSVTNVELVDDFEVNATYDEKLVSHESLMDIINETLSDPHSFYEKMKELDPHLGLEDMERYEYFVVPVDGEDSSEADFLAFHLLHEDGGVEGIEEVTYAYNPNSIYDDFIIKYNTYYLDRDELVDIIDDLLDA